MGVLNKKTIIILFLLLITTAGLLYVFNSSYSLRRIGKSIPNCPTGALDIFEKERFAFGIDSRARDKFEIQLLNTVNRVNRKGDDYKLKGVLFTGGKITHDSVIYYLISPSTGEMLTLRGSVPDTVPYPEDPATAQQLTINEEQIKSIITPAEAVAIATPILNCYKDFPPQYGREVYLTTDAKLNTVVWIVRVETIMPHVPGSNFSHSVKMNAFTGEVLEYR
jgi:hypothetical protein